MDGFLILGNSIAAAQAAWDLAEAGLRAYVVSEQPWFVAPGRDLDARAWLLQVSRHPNVEFLAPGRLESVESQGRVYRCTVRVGSRFVDTERCTNCGECEKVCPVFVPGTDHHPIWRPVGGVPDVYAIDKLGKAPCSNTCPGGIHVQGYVALISQGRFEEALALIREAIPFPAICGRVCDHPCEAECRRNEVDAPVAVRALKRFVADYEAGLGRQPSLLSGRRKRDDRGQGRRVAVIGSGPAGLTVATELVLLGYSVTVFEELPVPGGMLAVGIPKYRLPKDVLRAEIAAVEELGVEIHLNSPVALGDGDGLSLDDLIEQGFEAVFIGVGAHKSLAMRIPGEDAAGVVHGTRLLKMLNLSQQVEDPRWAHGIAEALVRGAETRAVIIGGGNTAMDASRSLRRLGLKDVSVLYRRSREEMPAAAEEVEDAEREGVKFHFQVAPVRVVEQGGRAVGVECIRTRLGEPDVSGRRRPVPVPGSEFLIEADLVVPAIGQAPEVASLSASHGLSLTREGTFDVDRQTYMTSRPGVFAAGDAITQPASVIRAIGSAKRAAAAIDAFLRGVPPEEFLIEEPEVPVAERDLTEADRVQRPRHTVPTVPMKQRMGTFDEVELGFDEAQAVAEASRCLSCGPCAECMACEVVCEPAAIRHEWREQAMDLAVVGVLVADDAVPDLESWGIAPLRVAPADREAASSQAALLMAQATGMARHYVESARIGFVSEEPRIGVWLCRCEGQISERLSIEEILDHASRLGDVAYVQALDQACSPEARAELADAMEAHNLNRAVVAACSCCSLDQVCYSCTTQRLRCKANLMSLGEGGAWVEFVNVREQCAWVYDDTKEATRAARALISAAVSRARLVDIPRAVEYSAMPSALVVGDGAAAREMARLLASVGLAASWASPGASEGEVPGVTALPAARVTRVGGAFGNVLVTLQTQAGARTATVGAVVFVGDTDLGRSDSRPSMTGLYTVPADADGHHLRAMAAKAAALLGRRVLSTGSGVAVVEETRCRACATCQEVCPFEAVSVEKVGQRNVAVVTVGRCVGCGLCAAHCPSGAMSIGLASDIDLEAEIQAACEGWK